MDCCLLKSTKDWQWVSGKGCGDLVKIDEVALLVSEHQRAKSILILHPKLHFTLP